MPTSESRNGPCNGTYAAARHVDEGRGRGSGLQRCLDAPQQVVGLQQQQHLPGNSVQQVADLRQVESGVGPNFNVLQKYRENWSPFGASNIYITKPGSKLTAKTLMQPKTENVWVFFTLPISKGSICWSCIAHCRFVNRQLVHHFNGVQWDGVGKVFTQGQQWMSTRIPPGGWGYGNKNKRAKER